MKWVNWIYEWRNLLSVNVFNCVKSYSHSLIVITHLFEIVYWKQINKLKKRHQKHALANLVTRNSWHVQEKQNAGIKQFLSLLWTNSKSYFLGKELYTFHWIFCALFCSVYGKKTFASRILHFIKIIEEIRSWVWINYWFIVKFKQNSRNQ